MDLQLSTASDDRSLKGGATAILRNMYAETQTATDGRAVSLETASGIASFSDTPEGDVSAMTAREGLFNGDVFSVHGASLYRTDSSGQSTQLGQVDGDGPVTLAASRNEVLICVSPNLYSYNGGDIAKVDMAGRGCSSITQIGQRFVGTAVESDRFYWSALLDGRTWEGLNFATAEGRADTLVRAFATSQYIVLFGTETIELYGLNASPRTESDAFYRLSSGTMNHGLLAAGTVAQEDAFVFWLSDKKTIYAAAGYTPNKISSPYVQSLINQASDDELARATGFTYTEDGHTFYVFTVPGRFSVMYDLGAGKWVDRDTIGRPDWRAHIGVRAFNRMIVADTTGSALLDLSLEHNTDLGLPMIQEFSAPQPIRNSQVIEGITLDMFSNETGRIAMQFTENGGRTYTDWTNANMSSPDSEDTQVNWRPLGTGRPPERVYRFRCSVAARLTVRGCRINEGVDA